MQAVRRRHSHHVTPAIQLFSSIWLCHLRQVISITFQNLLHRVLKL